MGQKKYVWLPDVELQREHLETGNDTYTVNVTFLKSKVICAVVSEILSICFVD